MAKLSSRKRKKLRKSQFVFPEQRAFPIDTAARARNALARCNQADPKRLGMSSSESVCSKVQREVDKKFPGIEVTRSSGKKRKKKRT